LYAAYENWLAALKLADREDLTRGGLQVLQEKGLPRDLKTFSSLEISQLYDFPPLRLELLLALAQRCESERIGFHLRVPAGGNPAVDAAVDPILAEFERRGQALNLVDAFKDDLSHEDLPLAFLGRALFAAESPSAGANIPTDRLAVFSAATARDEARQLARKAVRLLEQGVAPERVAIAYRDLDEEAEWVAEALEDFGAPAYVRRGAPLVSTAVGRIALELPLLADENFPAARVARVLTSRYVPAVSVGAPPAPASLLALASIRDDRLGASGGRGAYEVRLSALKARLEKKAPARARDAAALLELSQRLIAMTQQLASAGPASELLQQWWECLRQLGLGTAIRQREQREEEGTSFGRAVLRGLARDQSAFEALESMVAELDAALKLSSVGSEPISRRAFNRWLMDAALDFNLSPKGPRGGAVQVLGVRDLVGRRFSHVLVGGLSEGRFPGRDRSQALFTEEDRWAVNRCLKREVFRLKSGEYDGRASWRLAEDRLLFYLALACAEQTVTLSYARLGKRGQPQAPSPFLDELRRVTGCQADDLPLRPITTLEEVNSEQQLRERVALEAFSPPTLRLEVPEAGGRALCGRFSGEPWYSEAEHLTSLEEERLRFFSDPERAAGAFSGLVNGPEINTTLASQFHFGPDRPVSASTLGKYGNCAFQGFLTYGLKLVPSEEPGEELDQRRRGSFWHGVLQALFPRLHDLGLLNRPVEEIPSEVIDAALAEAADAAEQEDHVGHPALWALARDKARSMVRRVLGAEIQGLPFEGHVPKYMEHKFGRSDAPERWRSIKIPGEPGETDVFVEGKVDRVDTGPASIAVLDYKSGRIETGKKLLERLLTTEFQLPLYLYAARASGEGRLVRGAWLSLRDGKHFEFEDTLRDYGVTLSDLLSVDPAVRERMKATGGKNLANEVHALLSRLRAGNFAIRPLDCTYCEYRSVCRITDRRLPEVRDA
jgi:ATP-dependent helicase/DNAse subunit B